MGHVGIDVHQKYDQVCEISDGEVAVRAQISTTQASLMRHFGGRERLRIVLECGGSSRWVARLLRELGHQVVVVNPRRVRLIAESTLKTDAIDAEILARSPGSDPGRAFMEGEVRLHDVLHRLLAVVDRPGDAEAHP